MRNLENISAAVRKLYAKINTKKPKRAASEVKDRPGLPFGGFDTSDVGSPRRYSGAQILSIKIFEQTLLTAFFFQLQIIV